MGTSDKNIEIGDIVVVENFTPKDEILDSSFEYPHQTLLHEIIGIFGDCDIRCSIIVGNESEDFLLTSGCVEPISIENIEDKFSVVISADNIGENALISYLSIYLISLGPIVVETSDIKIVQHPPEHNRSVLFDVEKALEMASGSETETNIEAQIKAPDGSVFTIKKSSANFVWRGKKLYCSLPTGQVHFFRIRYDTENTKIGWSNWLKFNTKRKMSL